MRVFWGYVGRLGAYLGVNIYIFVRAKIHAKIPQFLSGSASISSTDTFLSSQGATEGGTGLAGKDTAHVLSNFFLPYYQEWGRAFVVFAGGDPDAIKPYTSYEESEVAELLTTPGDAKFNDELHRRGLLSGDDEYVCPSAAGGAGGAVADANFTNDALGDSDDEDLEAAMRDNTLDTSISSGEDDDFFDSN